MATLFLIPQGKGNTDIRSPTTSITKNRRCILRIIRSGPDRAGSAHAAGQLLHGTEKGVLVNMLLFRGAPNLAFFMINPPTKQSKTIASDLAGDITEDRASEIIANKYDPDARIKKGVLYFNRNKLRIVPFDAMLARAEKILEEEDAAAPVDSAIILLSQGRLKEKILNESRPGGKMDVWTPIAGHESDGVLFEGFFTTKGAIAIMAWAKMATIPGVSKANDVIGIYEALKARKAGEQEVHYLTQHRARRTINIR